MILIIDGYNLLFHECWPYQGGILEDRRKELISLVSQYKYENNIRRVVLVFDGCAGIGPYAQEFHQDGVEIIYAICQGKADEKIISINRVLNDVYIVTADRGLAKKAKRHRTNIIAPENFSKELFQRSQNNKEQKPVPTTCDVDKWLDEFGLEDEIQIPSLSKHQMPPIPKKNKEPIEDALPKKKSKKKTRGRKNDYDEDEGLLDPSSVEDWLEWFKDPKNKKK